MPLAINETLSMPGLTAQPKRYFDSFLGFDIDQKIVEQATKNLVDIKIQNEDIFSSKIHNIENSILIFNPPYGIRIGSNINAQFFENIIFKAHEKFNPSILGIIIPDEFKINFPDICKILSKRSLSNGGINVSFYVLGFK
jgi:23S rRNA G2445 N2-methylase RlmL